MRYSPEHKEQTRDRILKAAARRFRSRGSEGAAIGDLMKGLRLTHGGFYKHFDSKESLFLEAFTRALDESKSRADAAIRQAPPGPDPGQWCPLPIPTVGNRRHRPPAHRHCHLRFGRIPPSPRHTR